MDKFTDHALLVEISPIKVTFVSNRVPEVQELTADHLSRGMFAKDILDSTLWWHGPAFLNTFNSKLNDSEIPINQTNIPEERKVSTLSHLS